MFMWKQHLSTIDAVCYRVKFYYNFGRCDE